MPSGTASCTQQPGSLCDLTEPVASDFAEDAVSHYDADKSLQRSVSAAVSEAPLLPGQTSQSPVASTVISQPRRSSSTTEPTGGYQPRRSSSTAESVNGATHRSSSVVPRLSMPTQVSGSSASAVPDIHRALASMKTRGLPGSLKSIGTMRSDDTDSDAEESNRERAQPTVATACKDSGVRNHPQLTESKFAYTRTHLRTNRLSLSVAFVSMPALRQVQRWRPTLSSSKSKAGYFILYL